VAPCAVGAVAIAHTLAATSRASIIPTCPSPADIRMSC
jgi:hypothetical protein